MAVGSNRHIEISLDINTTISLYLKDPYIIYLLKTYKKVYFVIINM
jgi:hypothetical protein